MAVINFKVLPAASAAASAAAAAANSIYNCHMMAMVWYSTWYGMVWYLGWFWLLLEARGRGSLGPRCLLMVMSLIPPALRYYATSSSARQPKKSV